MPQFDSALYLSQIFWLILSFGFLYVMMSRLICPMLDEVLQERSRFVADTLRQAEKLNGEALALHQRYQAYILSAEKEKSGKIQNAYLKIRQQNAAKERRNESDLRRKVKQADQKITQQSEAFKTQSAAVAAPLAEQLAERLIQQEAPL